MTEEESIETIRRAFSCVPVNKIEVVNDPHFGRLAKVYVAEIDLDAALGGDAINARRAAMESGIDVEVAISD